MDLHNSHGPAQCMYMASPYTITQVDRWQHHYDNPFN